MLNATNVMRIARASRDRILKEAPIPKKEVDDLEKIVMNAANAGIPLELIKISIDASSGRFCANMRIPPEALLKGPSALKVKADMTARTSAIVSKYGAWHAGDKNSLTYKSAQAYDILKGPQSPAPSVLNYLGIKTSGPQDPITSAIIAGSESIIKTALNGGSDFQSYKAWISSILTKTAPNVERSISRLDVQRSPSKTWDTHTDRRIGSLHPKVRTAAFEFINRVEREHLIRLRVTFGYRSSQEQEGFYQQGRTTPGLIVTNARGGQSYHNYGLAIDVVEIGANGSPLWHENNMAFWNKTATIAKQLGFEWGGDWSRPDLPHFQMTYGLSIEDLQNGKRP